MVSEIRDRDTTTPSQGAGTPTDIAVRHFSSSVFVFEDDAGSTIGTRDRQHRHSEHPEREYHRPKPTQQLQDGREKQKGTDKKTKKPLTLEQRRALEQFQREKKVALAQRIEFLATALLERIEPVVTTMADPRSWQRFESRIRHEAESIKLEPFGLEFLNEIGKIYTARAKAYHNSLPLIGGLLQRVSDGREEASDILAAHQQALKVRSIILEMEEEDELLEDEREAAAARGDPPPRKRNDAEETERKTRMTGLVLSIFYHTSMKEIHDVIR